MRRVSLYPGRLVVEVLVREPHSHPRWFLHLGRNCIDRRKTSCFARTSTCFFFRDSGLNRRLCEILVVQPIVDALSLHSMPIRGWTFGYYFHFDNGRMPSACNHSLSNRTYIGLVPDYKSRWISSSLISYHAILNRFDLFYVEHYKVHCSVSWPLQKRRLHIQLYIKISINI